MSAIEWRPDVGGRRRVDAGYRNRSNLSSYLSIGPESRVAMAELYSDLSGCETCAKVLFQLLATGPRFEPSFLTTADWPFDDEVEGGWVGDSRVDRQAA